jgi:hypothetical protein
MIERIPTNTEIIFRQDLSNKLISEIPYCKYNIMGEKIKGGNWKITIYDRYGYDRKVLTNKASEYEFAMILEYALTPKH